ncbi:toll/interleukin-1 receptor (TIR) domain-containing protein [Artemisia annua]|uniref:Toll/interleukin-1 receptor (TIR) domain-containing protein n=1 Tax=Artemisia annua TaxID=35608 RepID=A0A2U1P8H3_ARTAN|nr:toll/interleukin-1 receptor (TIR) domain-containing protein [Artemisia annua]
MVPSHPSYCTPDSSSKLRNHSVFLNYRGIDTGSNFVDHLYSALDQAEIPTYMKEDTFPLDESFTPSHIKAIEESQIALIIFSPNYAASSWCLDELAYIMKCMVERGITVMPVYYGVHSWTVRRQRGVYEEAFKNHGHVKETNKVESWRKAVMDASNLFGWEISDKHESKHIKLIVDTISKRLFPDNGFIGAQTRLEGLRYGGGGGMATFTWSREEVEHLKIPLQDIQLATNNFARENAIARGGFGHVFRGQTGQHGNVAIKRLNRRDGQGEHQFMMEIELLSTYKHENIVSLVGYCDEGGERILVYRYEKNGSLDKVLPRKDLTWIQRLQICLDAAHGLEYLHDNVAHHIIVHRDIKSANILLDETWKAKISDFGLSKIALANVPCSVIFSMACGTPGYVDPLYEEHDMLTQKSDVYSFGIVMLEVLFGRLVTVDPKYPIDRYFLLSLAQDHYVKETLDEIIDSDLRSQMNSDSLITFSRIAYQCLKKRREERPTMSLVVDQLEKALDYQQGLSGYLHDVYISFRNRDTECHIVDDIRATLDQEGISTYKNDVTQSRKESILLKAIERSRLFVIIFTKKFAVNSWYLDEVAKITECSRENGQVILPIFYNVSSSDVRTQKGYFGEVMSEYDTHPRIETWRNALVNATVAAGLEYSKFWCNADLVIEVVKEIKSSLSAKVN